MKKSNKQNNNKNNEEKEAQAADTDNSERSIAPAISDGRFWRGRKRQISKSTGSALSTDEEAPRCLMPPPGRKKSRKKEFLREDARADSEKDVEEQARIAAASRCALGLTSADGGDSSSAANITKQVQEDVAIIMNVATKSKNLKGSFKLALREAASSLEAAVKTLYSRSSSEETAKLQADNERLQQEVADLRKELVELRAEVERVNGDNIFVTPCQPREQIPQMKENMDVDKLIRSIMLQVGGMVNARFEALEERLLPEKRLRPPLAADRAASAKEVTPNQKNKSGSVAKASVTASKQARKEGKTIPPTDTAVRSVSSAIRNLEEPWSVVTRKDKKKKKVNSAPVTAQSSAKSPINKQSVKLRQPRTSAVVITLQPGAEEQGVTYANLLAKAKEAIDLPSCGITGLKFRTAATGARILEVPGATSGDKADILAQKLKETLDEGLAKVSRPVKCAELRITGLDDSVTPLEICAAIAQCGECSVESVKVGEIHSPAQGAGSVWVRCPVAAAKKMEKTGRLLVGWVSAKVTLLPTRSLRCYKCLQTGHVRAQCTVEADRSNECYRCGKPGHKANTCTAAPNCSICAAANRSADHRLGSKACSPPKPKKSRAAAISSANAENTPAANSCPPSQGVEEAMAVS